MSQSKYNNFGNENNVIDGNFVVIIISNRYVKLSNRYVFISSLGICQTLKLEIHRPRKVENSENGHFVRLGQIVNFTFWVQK